MVRVVAALLVLALVMGVGIAAIAPMAGAHGDEGVLAVVSATPSGTSSTITVKLTYEGDGHAVDGATVTVVADNGSGTALDPLPMNAGSAEGEYTATVEFPSAGTWNVRVTSVSPAATLTLTQDITSEPGVTAGTAPEESTTTADPALDEEVTDSPTTVADGDDISATSESDDSDSSPLPWILGGIAVVVIVAVSAVFVMRGRNQGPID